SQKTIAAVVGVGMLGVVAFESPSVMSHLNQRPPVSTAATSTTPAGTPSLAAPTLGGSEQPAAAASGGSSSLTSGDVPPPANDGQLASFSRFASKDPFAQQLSDDPTASCGSGGGSSSSSGGSSPGFGGTSGSGSGGVPSP